MALQGFVGAGTGGEVPFVIVAAGQRAGGGLVDIFPVGVDRQLAGNLFLPAAFLFRQGRLVDGIERGRLGQAGGLDIIIAAVAVGRIGGVVVIAVVCHLQHGIGLQRFLHLLLE